MKQAATSFSITVLVLISGYLNPSESPFQPCPIKQRQLKQLLRAYAAFAAARA